MGEKRTNKQILEEELGQRERVSLFNPEALGRIKREFDRWQNTVVSEQDKRNWQIVPRLLLGSGVPRNLIYSPLDCGDLDYIEALAFPGEEPFTRGIYPNMYRGRVFTMRQLAGFGGPEPRYSRVKAGNCLWNHYQCKDGKWLVLCMVQSQRYWASFCSAIGVPQLANDPRFADAEGRRLNSAELISILDKVFATRDRAGWEKLLTEGGDFIFQSVQDLDELENDPQVIANRYIVDFDHPVLGKVKMLNCPVTFSETPATIRRAAPEFGENTEEVLVELGGYSWEEIEQLKEEGVI